MVESISSRFLDLFVSLGTLRQLHTSALLLVPGYSIPILRSIALEFLYARFHYFATVFHAHHFIWAIHTDSSLLLLAGDRKLNVPILKSISREK